MRTHGASVVGLFGCLPDRPSRFPAGFEQESIEGDHEMAEELAGKHFAGSWLSYRQYKEEYKEDPVEYQRNQYDTAGATQPLDSVPENGTVNSP